MFIGNEAFDLQLSLIDSAQCFHWRSTETGYVAAVNGQALRLWREKDGMHAESTMPRDEIRRYLDLDRDYRAIALEYAHIPQAKCAIELYPGLRVLRQPPWEALVAFILSANNNVGRIRSLVNALNRSFGTMLDCDGEIVYSFPQPQTIASCSEERLRALGMGYRAPYIRGAAQLVADGFPLDALVGMEYEEAHSLLTRLPGVGDKVADCVLLFGCGHSSAFPVDVWVERLLFSWFDAPMQSRKRMTCFARERLGEHAGLLQQFLFHAARTGDIEIN